MIVKESKNDLRKKRHARVRNKVSGTAECPRLNVFRSNTQIFAQIIDDVKGVTLASSSSVELKIKNGGNVEGAKLVGKDIAEKAKLGINKMEVVKWVQTDNLNGFSHFIICDVVVCRFGLKVYKQSNLPLATKRLTQLNKESTTTKSFPSIS